MLNSYLDICDKALQLLHHRIVTNISNLTNLCDIASVKNCVSVCYIHHVVTAHRYVSITDHTVLHVRLELTTYAYLRICHTNISTSFKPIGPLKPWYIDTWKGGGRQNVDEVLSWQSWTSWEGRWIGHWMTTWSTLCSSSHTFKPQRFRFQSGDIHLWLPWLCSAPLPLTARICQHAWLQGH